jgi:hypothetical protein
LTYEGAKIWREEIWEKRFMNINAETDITRMAE